MKWINDFKYHTLSKIKDINGLRLYKVGNKNIPSVTTILDQTKSSKDKESLLRWRKNVGEKEADKIIRKSLLRGTRMHSFIEKYLVNLKPKTINPQISLNLDINNDEKAQPEVISPLMDEQLMADKIIFKGLNKYGEIKNLQEIWGNEVNLFYDSSLLQFAGTCDLCGIYEDRQSIIDFKSSGKEKKIEHCEDYFLQTAAYAIAHDYLYKTQITQAVLLICTPPPQLLFTRYLIKDSELENYKKSFLERVKQYNILTNNNPVNNKKSQGILNESDFNIK